MIEAHPDVSEAPMSLQGIRWRKQAAEETLEYDRCYTHIIRT